jgi:NarL family two-component system response regulator LiaR
MDKIRIIIIDDDVDWLKRLSCFLNDEPDLHVIGTVTNKNDAEEFIKSTNVDIVLMDLDLGENPYEGIEITKKISESKTVKVIIVSSYTMDEMISNAFEVGAVHYFPKTYYKDIPNAIRLTYQNASPVEILLKNYFSLKKEMVLNSLTPAERRVFDYVEQGISLREIAEKLNKTVGTIKLQVNSILKKLDVKTRKQAVQKYRL